MSTLYHPKLPKYVRLGQELREQIASGALKPGEKLPTVAELRAQFGVSVTTLDKVLTALEQEGLITRSQGSGIYVAQPQKATGIIGVVGPAFVHSPDVPYWANLLSGLRASAQGQGREILLLGDSAPGLGWEKIDGVLLCGGDDGALRRLPPGMPAVSLMYPSHRLPGVVADDREATKALTEHLLRLGHRRIAFLTMGLAPHRGPWLGAASTSGARHGLGYGAEAENGLSRLRGEGYQSALWQAGIEPNPLWVRELMAPGSSPRPFDELGHDEMSRWLREDWQSLGCTALLAQNDEAAIGAIHALREAGLSVPEDVSVAGFDGTRIGEYCTPRLTSVRVPLREIAEAGIELLLRQITEQEAATGTTVLPTSLLVRASTAPPRALLPQRARASRKRKKV